MLKIYPQERPGALDMMDHRWLRNKVRGKNHLLSSPESVEAGLRNFKNKVKNDPIFYRELKDFAEELNDADGSFDMNDEEVNEHVGFSRPRLPRPRAGREQEARREELREHLHRLRRRHRCGRTGQHFELAV